MYLEFTDEQLELRDSARAALARECPPRHVRGVAAGDRHGDELGTALSWLGWPALTIDVDLGGLGRTYVELAIVLEELGRAAAPGSFLPTMTQFVPAVRAIGTTAQAHRFLAAVASGQLTGTLALHEGGRWDPRALSSTAERDGDGWLLRGHKQHVLGAPDVDEVLVAARRDSGSLGLFVVPAAELTFKRTTSFDPTRSLANVELNGIWVPDARVLGEPERDAEEALGPVLAEATVGLALDALGGCSALLDAAMDAARQSDASGQAAEHTLADMVVAIELARAATYHAMSAVAEDDATAIHAASVAKAVIGDCCRMVATRALELCGTAHDDEGRDLLLWIGRVTADDLLYGSAADHRRQVADRLLDPGWASGPQIASALLDGAGGSAPAAASSAQA